ncbi:hypothetical protein [uncultured Parabacteroides sp.]|uniref:hypothetical protein n=1 Tax=uncultured Parabacteroides sp. TaxID=512312 RepID=UPI00265B1303|nr:hypothetical protein [uncultured Parabacteroides sp.]
MRKQHTYKPVALRFKRWSRKGYAAFISIQHAVTIGQLSANVSERFQVKNGCIHASVLPTGATSKGETEEEDDICWEERVGSILSLILLQAVCPIRTISRPAASHADTRDKDISGSAEGFNRWLNAFRAFRLYLYSIIGQKYI